MKVLSWRSFFVCTYASAVFTWGDASGGRCGHGGSATMNQYYEVAIPAPKELKCLTGQGIDFIGKTAEMGSIALAFGGRKVFVWGTYARSQKPLLFPSHLLCGNETDRAIDASCHHDSGFIIVFESGLTLVGNRRFGKRGVFLFPCFLGFLATHVKAERIKHMECLRRISSTFLEMCLLMSCMLARKLFALWARSRDMRQ